MTDGARVTVPRATDGVAASVDLVAVDADPPAALTPTQGDVGDDELVVRHDDALLVVQGMGESLRSAA